MWGRFFLAFLFVVEILCSQSHDGDRSKDTKVKAGCDPDYGWIDGVAGSNKCYMALTYADQTNCYYDGGMGYGMTWFESMQCCYAFGGYLAEVGSEEEQAILVNHAQLVGEHAYYWLGGTDLHHEGGFVWLSGRKFGYTAWGEGEPNEGGEGSEVGEDCVAMDGGRNYLWNDAPCDQQYSSDYTHFAFCEKTYTP